MTTVSEPKIIRPPESVETWVMQWEQLQAAFEKSGRGDVLVYAIGDLHHKRMTARGKDWSNVEHAAEYVYDLYETGNAELTQKKLGPNKYEYRVTKR